MPEFSKPAIYAPDFGGYIPVGIPHEPPRVLTEILSDDPCGLTVSFDGKRWTSSSRGFYKVQNEVLPGGVFQILNAHDMNAEEISSFLGEINMHLRNMPDGDEKNKMNDQFNLACSRFEEMLALSD